MTAGAGITVDAGGVALAGDLMLPDAPNGVVLFAHGSASSRHSPRNRAVAGHLNHRGLATLLIDLLTAEEQAAERRTGHLRFDIPLLIDRLGAAFDRVRSDASTYALPVGCFGASTGAAAALGVAGRRPGEVAAVVSRGGRPDLTPPGLLAAVQAPTLLIVGGRDTTVLDLNRDAQRRMNAAASLEVVADAGHLFEEAGALQRVAALAGDWFVGHLTLGNP
jgi:pimeloyl-ACP methyl ester carboxylesterase